MPNDPDYEIAFLGAARAGIVPTPLNPSYKEREVRHQLDEAGASAIVSMTLFFRTCSRYARHCRVSST